MKNASRKIAIIGTLCSMSVFALTQAKPLRHFLSELSAGNLSSRGPASELDAYGISVISKGDVSPERFQHSVDLVTRHLIEHYSPEFIRATGLKEIRIYPVLHYNDASWFASSAAVGGITDRSTVYLATSYGNGNPYFMYEPAVQTAAEPSQPQRDCSAFPKDSTDLLNCMSVGRVIPASAATLALQQRDYDSAGEKAFIHTLDHELFHVIDVTALSSFADNNPFSQTWLALNPPGFQYISGGGMTYVKQEGDHGLGQGRPGFISDYAASSIMEDKAEIFSNFMDSPNAFAAKARQDTILGAKFRVTLSMIRQLCSTGCQLPLEFRSPEASVQNTLWPEAEQNAISRRNGRSQRGPRHR